MAVRRAVRRTRRCGLVATRGPASSGRLPVPWGLPVVSPTHRHSARAASAAVVPGAASWAGAMRARWCSHSAAAPPRRGGPDQSACPRKRRSRRLSPTTKTELNAMTAPAIIELSRPTAARGVATTLQEGLPLIVLSLRRESRTASAAARRSPRAIVGRRRPGSDPRRVDR